jgi:hypothetical protein
VDDLHAIVFFQNYRRPIAASDDPLVKLNREALNREIQIVNQILQRQFVRDFV